MTLPYRLNTFPFTLLNSRHNQFKVHPFFVLLFSAIAYGFYDRNGTMKPFINSINNWIGDIIGKKA